MGPRDANCRAISVYVRGLQKHDFELAGLTDGLEVEVSDLERPSTWLDWDTAATVLDRMRDLVGGGDAWTEFAADHVVTTVERFFSYILQMAATPAELYRLAVRVLIPAIYPIHRAGFEWLAPDTLNVSLTLPDEVRGSEAFFQAASGTFKSLPRNIKLADSAVDAVLSPRRGEYIITLPAPAENGGVMSPLSSTASQSALSELSRQHLELRDQYDEQRKAYDAFRNQQVDVENEVARKQRVRREFDVQEIELHHAQNMEAIGQLSGGIAHDFNNHLTVILGYTEILLQTVFDAASREYVEKIRDSAFASASLSKQLLTFARHQVLKPKILDLNEFLDATQAVLRRAVGDAIVIGFERGPNVGSVSLDRKQFEQVLLNLAINAREAIGQSRGRLMIETASVYLDGGYADTHPGVTPGDHVMLSVSDNGPGMAPEILARIFEPFFTTKETGTGLGLSMVRGIVAQSGGTINVSSEAGSGTSFRIYLPRVATDERDAEPEQIRAEAVGDEHVLVIEDEVRFGDIVAATLARHGYKVTVARNGNDALAKVAESIPDLVLSDIVMSGMNGVETVEKLHDQFGDVPAIYMSGYTENAILRRGVQPNDLVLLQKPFTHRELLSAIRVVLDDV